MADPKNGIVVDDVADDARLALEEVNKAAEVPVEEPVKAEAPVETEPKADRARGPDGKFVKKEESAPEPKEAPVADGVKPQGDAPATPEAPQAAPAPTPAIGAPAGPPPGFSIKTKANWEKIAKEYPELVADIAKRNSEVANGYKMYEGLGPFVEMAQRAGRPLAAIVQGFHEVEASLRRDPSQGFASIAERVGMSREQYAQFCLQQAQRFGAVPPSAPQEDLYRAQPEGAPPSFDPNAFAPILQPITQKLSALEQTFNQTRAEIDAFQQRPINQAVERFRSDPAHRFFEDVRELMVKVNDAGLVKETGDTYADLKATYEAACKLHPEIGPILDQERIAKTEETRKQRDAEIAAKAKAAGKSITGASVPAAIIPLPGEDDIYAAARAAVRQHSL